MGTTAGTPTGDTTSRAPASAGDRTTDKASGNTTKTDTAAGTAPEHRRHSYHDGIMRVAPAVVSLYADGGDAGQSQGSGVIIDPSGIVLTNLHLLEGREKIHIVLEDGREFTGARIGDDPETDLAVVGIAATDLPHVPLEDARPLMVGDIVLTIGNPFGVGQTVTQGIVSATQRRIAGGSAWQDFVQIDAPINPGNSGGALIDPDGVLVGITTAVFRGSGGAEGIGYAIPAQLLAQVVPQIIENGYVARGWLGIGIDDISIFPALKALGVEGVLVSSVRDGSPANIAGLQPRDIVLRVGEKAVRTVNELMLTVSALPPGVTVKVSVLRGVASVHQSPARHLKEIDLKVKLGERPSSQLLSPSTEPEREDAPATRASPPAARRRTEAPAE